MFSSLLPSRMHEEVDALYWSNNVRHTRYLLQGHVGFLTRGNLGGGDTVPQDIPTYTLILGERED